MLIYAGIQLLIKFRWPWPNSVFKAVRSNPNKSTTSLSVKQGAAKPSKHRIKIQIFCFLLGCSHSPCPPLPNPCRRTVELTTADKEDHACTKSTVLTMGGGDLFIWVSLDFGPADNTIASNSPHRTHHTYNRIPSQLLVHLRTAVHQSDRFFPLLSNLMKTVIWLSVIESLSVLAEMSALCYVRHSSLSGCLSWALTLEEGPFVLQRNKRSPFMST